MTLIKRLSRLFQADLHAVLDHIEEPQALLQQSVREMEEELMKCQQHLQGMRVEHSHLCRRTTEIDRSLVELEQELDLCFGSNNHELARKLLKRKLRWEKMLQGMADARAVIEDDLVEQQSLLDENRTRYEDLCQQVELVANDMQVAEILGNTESRYPNSGIAVTDADVEIALLQEKQKRERS